MDAISQTRSSNDSSQGKEPFDEDYSKIGAILEDYHQVTFGENVRLSDHCTLCGRVSLGSNVTVFAGSHLRGDCAPITVGDGTNIQESCLFHVSSGKPLTIGRNCTVGHGAIVHGCTIGDNVLVGMGSIVMDDSKIGNDSLVAAGAIVTEHKEFPPRSLIMGVPARAVRELSDDEIQNLIVLAGTDYQKVAYAMEADGLLHQPTPGTSIWPRPQQ